MGHPFDGRYRKGFMKILRELKREEAEARNALTPDDRRKANRKEANDG